jgi:hypothetical protein
MGTNIGPPNYEQIIKDKEFLSIIEYVLYNGALA